MNRVSTPPLRDPRVRDSNGKVIGRVTSWEMDEEGVIRATAEITDPAILEKIKNPGPSFSMGLMDDETIDRLVDEIIGDI